MNTTVDRDSAAAGSRAPHSTAELVAWGGVGAERYSVAEKSVSLTRAVRKALDCSRNLGLEGLGATETVGFVLFWASAVVGE